MKHVRFYQDFGCGPEGKKAKRNFWKTKTHAPNVFALFLNDTKELEGLGALIDDPNSSVVSTGVSIEYLRGHCKRCSEEVARKIHPKLFKCLDKDMELERVRDAGEKAATLFAKRKIVTCKRIGKKGE